jgi:hypothetical protein
MDPIITTALLNCVNMANSSKFQKKVIVFCLPKSWIDTTHCYIGILPNEYRAPIDEVYLQ